MATYYWVGGNGNWDGTTTTNWSLTSGGTGGAGVPTSADDVIVNAASGSGTITLTGSPVCKSVNFTGFTGGLGASTAVFLNVYGNFTLGSTMGGISSNINYYIRDNSTIISNGKTHPGSINIYAPNATVQLGDALNCALGIYLVLGTFNTNGYNLTVPILNSVSYSVRTINLGSSIVTFSGGSPLSLKSNKSLTFNAGTSTINFLNELDAQALISFNAGTEPLEFYDINFKSTQGWAFPNIGDSTSAPYIKCRNLTISAPTGGIKGYSLYVPLIVTGTLTCSAASPTRRIMLRSITIGAQKTITAGSIVAQDCDFRDIKIDGAAANTSLIRAGDCGGNSGIVFPAPKTVYWNLGGTQNWSSTGWCTSSGGTPSVDNFPLAQDTAVFDNGGSAGIVSINSSWNIGTFDAFARTSAMTLAYAAGTPVYRDCLIGSGMTITSGNTTQKFVFSGRATQTIMSNGVNLRQFDVAGVNNIVLLADAVTASIGDITLISGTFDAASYNVTASSFQSPGSANRTLRMGSGLWTLTSTPPVVWGLSSISNLNFYKGTADIILSDTSTTARTFAGGGLSYNKLTIGGATGTSATTITGNNQFTELASTKTVAHTIAIGASSQTIGKWSISGSAGNVVTVTGTGTLSIAGSRVSGVDYLALGTTTISPTSLGEFYAGANSTGGTNAILTAAPTPVTRYWVGGSGTWDSSNTANWSASSGGTGGASVPTSADAVVFDSASSASAYTVTCTATQLRCGSFTMSAPASGNVTWAGGGPLAIHDNFTLAASRITNSYAGTITLSGSTTGKVFTTNGVSLASTVVINGIGCEWTLNGAVICTLTLALVNGSFDCGMYNLTVGNLNTNYQHSRTLNFGSGTITVSGTLNFGTSRTAANNLTFIAGTSQINFAAYTFNGNGKTFYDVAFTNNTANTCTISGTNTFNNLSFSGIAFSARRAITVYANQTINGTLTISAGTNATMRNFLSSDTIGTPRTLTCGAVSATDVDFRDITIAGTAAPISGTRFGDCKGNSGITFPAPKTVYWNLATGGNWGSTAWAITSGGTPSNDNFPLAQDTAIFEATGLNSGGMVTINASYNIGTIDMSARTSNTMTLAMGSNTPAIYGNWVNGTGTTISGTGAITFAGRGSQTITSTGKTFTQPFYIYTISGSVTLQDALSITCGSNQDIYLQNGTFDANGYNVTVTGGISAVGTSARTMAFGSGTWTTSMAGSSAFNFGTSTNLTVTGTGTISLTSASAKTFTGGGVSYSGITLNQGGAGALTITGDNTFYKVSSTYAPATIIFPSNGITILGDFAVSGTPGNLVTLQSASSGTASNIQKTGGGLISSNYLSVKDLYVSPGATWYAGVTSTNVSNNAGWSFTAPPSSGNFMLLF